MNRLQPLWILVVFLAGVVFSANLTRLVGTADTYNAQWWKVICSLGVGIMCGFLALPKVKDAPPELEAENIGRGMIRLFYADLEPVNDDALRRNCPFCSNGMLLLKRDGDGVLEPNDRCIGCGQQVEYLDIDDLKKS